MSISKKTLCTQAILDSIIITLVTTFILYSLLSGKTIFLFVLWILTMYIVTFNFKNVYSENYYGLKKYYNLFESIIMASLFSALPLILFNTFLSTFVLLMINGFAITIALFASRLLNTAYNKIKKREKNILIVGAGQDGKFIAEEIQARPELGLKVVGFLDDNMNNLEDEDSSIPVLGLTCDSEAVIKDNNVEIVIIAVKSRMDSSILTDLIKGIPLGVKVWRMPKFYEKIAKKYYISKMTVNWLFYAGVKKKALLFAYIKRICDIVASILIMLLTLPISIIAAMIVKFSDFGPIFFTQTRIGKFEKPFKMVKFRTMYQNEVDETFDDDLDEISADDKRIMPLCKILRKFHIDELPQMINILKGEMSLVGPRPVREEVYYENKNKIPYWECRNWVRPGWSGWQQINDNEPDSTERLEYDLYYIKHKNILWEVCILLKYFIRVLTGKCQ